MPKLILDRNTMRIIRAPKPTPAKPLPIPDVSWTIQKGEDGYPATLKAVPVHATQTPSAANATPTPYTMPAVIADGRVVLTYR